MGTNQRHAPDLDLINMGNSNKKLSRDDIDELKANTTWSQEEIENMYAVFKEDHPSSDQVTLAEFKELFKVRLGDGDNVDALFQSFDRDDSGTLDFKELCMALSMSESGAVEDKLGMFFNLYDTDGNGTLSRDELDDMRERILAIGGHHLDGQVLATNIAHLDAAIEQLDEDHD